MLKTYVSEIRHLGYSSKTIKDYTRHLLEFEYWLAQKNLSLSTHEEKHAREYVRYLTAKTTKGKKYSTATIAIKAHAIASYWKKMKYRRIVLPIPKMKTKLVHWLSEDVINSLYQQCKTQEEQVAFLVGYELAFRRQEIVFQKIEHIDFDTHQIQITKPKGGNEQAMYMPRGLESKLKQYLSNHRHSILFPKFIGDKGPSGYKFYEWIKKLAIKAKVPEQKASPHILRHSKAVHLRQHGMKIEDLRDFLRHKNIQTTLVYATFGTEDIGKTFKDIKSPLDFI